MVILINNQGVSIHTSTTFETIRLQYHTTFRTVQCMCACNAVAWVGIYIWTQAVSWFGLYIKFKGKTISQNIFFRILTFPEFNLTLNLNL